MKGPPDVKTPRLATEALSEQQQQASSKHSDNGAISQRETPEHHSDRRRFLIWSLMCGFVEPKRVVDRIFAEVESEMRR
jgi:hypothetical protein